MSSASDKNRYKVSTLMLEMLVCPLTKTRLTLSNDKSELISSATRVAFSIKKGVPLLCLSEARNLNQDEIDNLK